MKLINNIIINGYRGSFHPRSKLAGYSTEIKNLKDFAQLGEDEKGLFAISVENFLSGLESEFSKVHKKIIDLEDLSKIDEYEKLVFASFVICQWRRTKVQRDIVKDLILNYTKEEIAKTDSAEYIEFLVRLNYIEEVQRYFHITSMFFDIEVALKAFLSMGWTLYINKTCLSYWTSDNPVIIENINDCDSYKECQILKGCKIYFPLSPKVCLVIYDSSSYEFPSRLLDTNIQNVIDKNKFQVEKSARHVLSNENISLAKKSFKSNI